MSIMEQVPINTKEVAAQQAFDDPEKHEGILRLLKILQDRKANDYEAGSFSDGRKVGLAFEGGAYAGVVGLKMAEKLAEAGLLDYVDGYYGVSVGAVNAIYAATRQFQDGYDSYMIMPGRFSPELPKVGRINMDILRQAITKDYPVDFTRLNAKVPVVIGATRLEDSQAVKFKSTDTDPKLKKRDNELRFIERLMEGAHTPLLSRGGTALYEDGYHYSDAVQTWGSSAELAVEDGCSDVIVLDNVLPKDEIKPGAWAMTVDRYMKYFNADVKQEELYSTQLRNRTKTTRNLKANVQSIFPENLPGLPDYLTSDRERLGIGMDAAELAIQKLLELTRTEAVS